MFYSEEINYSFCRFDPCSVKINALLKITCLASRQQEVAISAHFCTNGMWKEPEQMQMCSSRRHMLF